METPYLILMNAILLESTLKKKINYIVKHSVREGIAKSEWRCGRVGANYSPSDLVTKSFIYG